MNPPTHLSPLQQASLYYQIPIEKITNSNLHSSEIMLSPRVLIRFVRGSFQYTMDNGQIHLQHVNPMIACPTCHSMCAVPKDLVGVLSCCGNLFCTHCVKNEALDISSVKACCFCGRFVCYLHAAYAENEKGKLVVVHPECKSAYEKRAQDQARAQRVFQQK
jgi:hypothetical protein